MANLWSGAWIRVHTSEVVEADVDEDIVSIQEVEGEHQGVLHRPQVGQDERVERGNHYTDTNQNQSETYLCVCVVALCCYSYS